MSRPGGLSATVAAVTGGEAGVMTVTVARGVRAWLIRRVALLLDRKSTRLNSSHMSISYAVHRDLHSFPTRRFPISLMRVSITASHPHALRRQHPGGEANVPAGRTFGHCCRRDWRRGWSHDGNRGPRRAGVADSAGRAAPRSEEHTSELQSHVNLVCRPPRSTLFPYTTLSDLINASVHNCLPSARSPAAAPGRRGQCPGREDFRPLLPP